MKYKRDREREAKKPGRRSKVFFDIQSMIMTVLTVITITTTIIMGLFLYIRYQRSIEQTAIYNAEGIADSTVDRLNSDLFEARQISNAANYNIIQEYDISSEEFLRQFGLLYESNKEKIQSIALYSSDGSLIMAEPVASEKSGIKASSQDWYVAAEADIENIQVSGAHMQTIFDDGSGKYRWVISLSRMVDINDGEKPISGILLVDMKYTVISEIMDRINETDNGTYYYLCDRYGNIVYHPRRVELDRGMFHEVSLNKAALADGTYSQEVDGGANNIVVRSLAYTGWKVVAVVPQSAQLNTIRKFGYYIVATTMILFMMLLVVNRVISRKISRPILKLNESVKAYETGGKNDIYIGGSSEIRHLGYSVQKSYEQIERLMDEIIEEQNLRRKSEIDVLQSQINPHFLYNTLESITWMVEAGKNVDAVFMISELAKLLRISLSKGKTIIKISDELQHSKSYMNIQKVRYKERFQTEFIIDEEINDYCTVKLIIQPLLENAIYYGVGNMDEDDGGRIVVRGEKKDDGIYITVEDNGMGMTEEIAANLLTDNSKVPKHGSGVGVINVHNRIRLMFGGEYGLSVYSEPDEGTKIEIKLPAIPFTEENIAKLEANTMRKGEYVK